MELKRKNEGKKHTRQPLLIVPYGIETLVYRRVLLLKPLLIVPYGIETSLHGIV